MRTTVYIDGYNFYYGCLQGTPWKWLDLRLLVQRMLASEAPGAEIVLIRYFTSPVVARLARRGRESVEAQNAYLKALRGTGIDVQLGRHQLDVGSAPRYVRGRAPDRDDAVVVWHLAEKETDVRLALHLYRDTLRMSPEQIVLISGDSDMVPVLEVVREDSHACIGLVVPRRESGTRALPVLLPSLVDWTRHFIRDEELAASQLPDRVPGKRKPALKPVYW